MGSIDSESRDEYLEMQQDVVLSRRNEHRSGINALETKYPRVIRYNVTAHCSPLGWKRSRGSIMGRCARDFEKKAAGAQAIYWEPCAEFEDA